MTTGAKRQGELYLVAHATSEDDLRRRFAEDPWAKSGMLTVKRMERWTVLLDG